MRAGLAQTDGMLGKHRKRLVEPVHADGMLSDSGRRWAGPEHALGRYLRWDRPGRQKASWASSAEGMAGPDQS